MRSGDVYGFDRCLSLRSDAEHTHEIHHGHRVVSSADYVYVSFLSLSCKFVCTAWQCAFHGRLAVCLAYNPGYRPFQSWTEKGRAALAWIGNSCAGSRVTSARPSRSQQDRQSSHFWTSCSRGYGCGAAQCDAPTRSLSAFRVFCFLCCFYG